MGKFDSEELKDLGPVQDLGAMPVTLWTNGAPPMPNNRYTAAWNFVRAIPRSQRPVKATPAALIAALKVRGFKVTPAWAQERIDFFRDCLWP